MYVCMYVCMYVYMYMYIYSMSRVLSPRPPFSQRGQGRSAADPLTQNRDFRGAD